MGRGIPKPTQAEFSNTLKGCIEQARAHGVVDSTWDFYSFMLHIAEVQAQSAAEVRWLYNIIHERGEDNGKELHEKALSAVPDNVQAKAIVDTGSKTKPTRRSLVARGEQIPDTVEDWKRHAHLLGDLIEEQRQEISKLKRKVNRVTQSRDKHKRDKYRLMFNR